MLLGLFLCHNQKQRIKNQLVKICPRRGRSADRSTHPTPVPACGTTAPGSSITHIYSRIFQFSLVSFDCLEGGLHLLSSPTCPVDVSFARLSYCISLPHVIGPTVSEYYEDIRLLICHPAVFFSVDQQYSADFLQPRTYEISQVLDASLHTCHVP